MLLVQATWRGTHSITRRSNLLRAAHTQQRTQEAFCAQRQPQQDALALACV
jgi:hypothetical protein